MQKAEPQHNQVQNQPAATQRKGAALESPQGEQLAQLEAMADASPQADRLAQLAAMANASPQAAAQRRTMGMIHDGPRMTAQRRAVDAIQSRSPDAAQRVEAEEPLQAKVAQREEAPAKRNDTGLPDNLKSGIESLSGMSMDNVRVHYNSSQPAQLNAHAYAQGTDIHVAPGQEQHLPHEAWHVVQQAQGRVQPTMQMKGNVLVNDDAGLEREADLIGGRAASVGVVQNKLMGSDPIDLQTGSTTSYGIAQLNNKKRKNEFDENSNSTGAVGDEQEQEHDIRSTGAEHTDMVDEQEQEDEEEFAAFWLRAVVHPTEDQQGIGYEQITIKDVSISPQRRKTQMGNNQGDHTVAWSLTIRSLEKALENQSLKTAVETLEGYLIDDEIADKNKNTQSRLSAFSILNNIKTINTPVGSSLTLFEQAISLYLDANQASSFATYGKYTKGNGEADALGILEKEDGGMEDVADAAKKLVALKNLTGDAKNKVVSDWYSRLLVLFPQHKKVLEDQLGESGSLSKEDVRDAVKGWNETKAKRIEEVKKKFEKDLESSDKTISGTNRDVGVRLNGDNIDSIDSPKLYANHEVKVLHLEIPDKVRAKTRFYPKQGAHSIAWTFLRQSLIKRFTNKTADETLKIIAGLANEDLVYLKSSKDDDQLAEELEELIRGVKKYTGNYPVSEWVAVLNNYIARYIELNQRMPTTTFHLGDRPTGKGEGKLNDKADKEWVDYAGYLDVGFAFTAMMRFFEEYSDASKDKRTKSVNVDNTENKAKKKKTTANEAVGDKSDKEKLPDLDSVVTTLRGDIKQEDKVTNEIKRCLDNSNQSKPKAYTQEVIARVKKWTLKEKLKLHKYTKDLIGGRERPLYLSDDEWPNVKTRQQELTLLRNKVKLEIKGSEDYSDFCGSITNLVGGLQKEAKEHGEKEENDRQSSVERLEETLSERFVSTLVSEHEGELKKVFQDFFDHLLVLKGEEKERGTGVIGEDDIKKIITKAMIAPLGEKAEPANKISIYLFGCNKNRNYVDFVDLLKKAVKKYSATVSEMVVTSMRTSSGSNEISMDLTSD